MLPKKMEENKTSCMHYYVLTANRQPESWVQSGMADCPLEGRGGWDRGGRCCAIHDGLSQNLADWLHIQENACCKQILNQHMLVLDQTSTRTKSISKPHERLKLLEGHIPAQALNELVIFLCMAMISSGGLLNCFIVKMICLIWHQAACSVHPTGEPGLICPTDGHMSGTNYLSPSDGKCSFWAQTKQGEQSDSIISFYL